MLGLLEHPNWDPVIFEVFGPLALRWYGLTYVLTFIGGYLIFRWLQKTGYLRCKLEDVTNYIITGVLGTFLGGRLGYLLFYQFDKLFLGEGGLSVGERFEMVYKVWDGGMSFHGGLIGVVVATMIYVWRKKHSFFNVMDAACHFVPYGIVCVRFGNFINGELYGRTINDASGNPIYDADKLPWYAMKFPTEMHDKRASAALQDALEKDYLAAHPDAKMVPKHFPELPVPADVWTKVEPLFPGRYPSQLVQLMCEGFLVLVFVWVLRRWVKRPGIIGPLFIMAYAVCRIPSELVRQPDTHIDPNHAENLGATAHFLASIGLTMGQLLCIGMFIAGIVLLVINSRRNMGEDYTLEQRQYGFWKWAFMEYIGRWLPKRGKPDAGKASD